MTPPLTPNRRVQFCDRLGPDWVRLANQLNIAQHDRDQWQKGHEANGIWVYLENRGTLSWLNVALVQIGRGDLVEESSTALIFYSPWTSTLTVLNDTTQLFEVLPRDLPALTPGEREAARQAGVAREWKRLHSLAERCYHRFRGLYLDMVHCRLGELEGGRHSVLHSF